ncbi:hypothetical protein, conserved [Eimeria maxima]|uniref:Transmembrane protein n=1 Tax=Eimeria maxima TaxID=5804 RepID=U6M6S1_EIMMA|nr:hypothetical protein, conserved [Eimeria maxima]CDJ57370.1 hypothetical protein, conserved [Eimeria maxima]
MRLQRLASQLLPLLLLHASVCAHLANTLSRNIKCTANEKQAQGLQQGDELLQSSQSADAECGGRSRVARGTKCGNGSRKNIFNKSEGTTGPNSSRECSSNGQHRGFVTDEAGGPSGSREFSKPWKQHLDGCKGVPSQKVLLFQQLGINHLAPLLLRSFGFLHSPLHLPVLLKRLKGVQHGVSDAGEARGSSRGGWWSFGLEWDAAVPLLRYFLSFLPFLLLLLSSLLLLLTSRSRTSGTVDAATEAAKTVSQARRSNSDAAYAALLLLLPTSYSRESKNGGKRSVMLFLLIIATAAIAATLAGTAADSLKAAGCEAPLAFDAFSGLQQEQRKGSRLQTGLSGLLEGLRQLPTNWESTAPATIAAARGYAAVHPTVPNAGNAAPPASTAASDLEELLQKGAAAAQQLRKTWLGSQYVLLQAETKVQLPPPQQQWRLLQGKALLRRSKRFLSALLPLHRWSRCNDNTDESSSSGSTNQSPGEANNKSNGSAYGAAEQFFFTPIPVHSRTDLDTDDLQKEQQFAIPTERQQQGLLRCMGAEELAAAASAIGDALDCALKQHVLMRQFVDGVLEPNQLVQQKKELLQIQQHVEDALQHGLPQLWEFVRLLLQASSRSAEELLRLMPLLLLAAVIVAAAAAAASFVRQLAAEQPVGKLYAACSSCWRAFGACCCIGASLLLLAAAVSADSANLLKSLLQDPTMLPRYFPLGNDMLEGMLLRSMQQQQDTPEGQQQQSSVAMLPIPKTQELEQVVETLGNSSHSKDLADNISMLQLQLEGHAGDDWLVNAEFVKCYSRVLTGFCRAPPGAHFLALKTWGPLPQGCVNPQPFQKPRAATAASATVTAAAAAARAAARVIKSQISRLLPQWRSKQQQTLHLQPPAPCYIVSQEIEDRELLSRFGHFISPKSTARLVSIFSLARRVDAAHAFIKGRNKAVIGLLQQIATGVEAMNLSMQRSMAVAEILRPLAHQQRQLEQGNSALERYETLVLLGALQECEARRVRQLQEDRNWPHCCVTAEAHGSFGESQQ